MTPERAPGRKTRRDDEYRNAIFRSRLPTRMIVVAVAVAHSMDYGSLGSAYPGVDLLAERTGFHRRTVQRTLAELVDAGWLQRTHKGGGRGHATIYKGMIPKGWRDATLSESSGPRERVAVDTAKGGTGPPHPYPTEGPVPGPSAESENGSRAGGFGSGPGGPTPAPLTVEEWHALDSKRTSGGTLTEREQHAWKRGPRIDRDTVRATIIAVECGGTGDRDLLNHLVDQTVMTTAEIAQAEARCREMDIGPAYAQWVALALRIR
jgi:hypothetical protein